MRKAQHFILLAVLVAVPLASVGTASATAASFFQSGEAGKQLNSAALTKGIWKFEKASDSTCGSEVFKGKTEGLSYGQQKLSATFSECDLFGFSENATINTQGCTWNLQAAPGVGGSELRLEGCTSGGIVYKVENVFATCEAVVPNQNIPSAVSYANRERAVGRNYKTIAVAFAIHQMAGEVRKSKGLCPLKVGATKANFDGTFEIAAEGTDYFIGNGEPIIPSFHSGTSAAAPLQSSPITKGVWSFQGAEFACGTEALQGNTEGLSYGSQKLHPTFTGCALFGFTEGISMNTKGCVWSLQAASGVGGSELRIEGCSSGGISYSIHNSFYNCEIVMPNQNVPAAVSYLNNEPVGKAYKTIQFKFATHQIAGEVTESKGMCPFTLGKLSAGFTGTFEVAAGGTDYFYSS